MHKMRFERWSARRKNCSAEIKPKGAGDFEWGRQLDAETKLIRCWFVG
jgi:hypothetical protein